MFSHASNLPAAIADTRQGGAAAHVVAGATSKSGMLSAIAGALAFPDWFGHNLDALHDCLIDLSWLPPGEHVVILQGHQGFRDADPAGYHAVLGVLRDAAAETRRNATTRPLSVVLVTDDGPDTAR